jgi:hypothetical protein
MFAGIVPTGLIGVLAIVSAVALLGSETLPETVAEVMLGIVLLGMLVFVVATTRKIVRELSRP